MEVRFQTQPREQNFNRTLSGFLQTTDWLIKIEIIPWNQCPKQIIAASSDRSWDNIWLAGSRDTEPGTLFDKIVAKEIPASIIKEDDKILAFKDINPAAPAHVLVIPKDRDGLTRLSKSTPEHYEILGRLMVAAGEIAKDESLGFGDGARIVINDGKAAGQEVFHLHREYINDPLIVLFSFQIA